MGVFNFNQAMFIIAGFLLISLITLTTLKLAKKDQNEMEDKIVVEI